MSLLSLFRKHTVYKCEDYEFIVNERTGEIIKFLPLKEGKIDTIVLPQLVKDSPVDFSINGNLTPRKKKFFRSYLRGQMKICSGCFDEYQGDLKLKLLANCSIRIGSTAFKRDTHVVFITADNLELKEVTAIFDSERGYIMDSWDLICDKNINIDRINLDDKALYEFSVHKLNYKYRNALIKVSHEKQHGKSDDCQI